MSVKGKILWLTAALGLLFTLVPVAIYSFEGGANVDTEVMLDVSVSIKTISHVRIDKIGDSVWNMGVGSGVLVSSNECEVWTNEHVIAGAAVIEVFPRKWAHASGIPATVVNATPRSDIAVLRMESCEGISEAKLGNSDTVQPGDETYAVGNPLGHNPDSISRGIISHTKRYLTDTTPYLQTDAAINPGNSGGALFNRNGEVIGINTAIASTESGTNVGIGYAIPVNLVKKVSAQLRTGPPSWGHAGIGDLISSLTPDEADVFKVPDGHAAIILTKEPTKGPSVGKLRLHDVIFKIDDIAVTDAAQAVRVLNSYDAGDTATFHLIRAGQVASVDVTLEEGWKADDTVSAEYYDGYLGMTIEMWSDEEGELGQFTHPVITMVHSLGPAHKAQIASSQRTFGYRGPFVIAYQLDVKTITGVVFDGEYHPVETVQALERVTAKAHAAGRPLLLEIEFWVRSNAPGPATALQHATTRFFRLTPAAAMVPLPNPADDAFPASDGVVEAANDVAHGRAGAPRAKGLLSGSS